MTRMRKILSILMIMLGGFTAFSACTGDPYKDIKVQISASEKSIVLSEEEADNEFVITATISGTKKPASIRFESSDNQKVSLVKAPEQSEDDEYTYIGRFVAKQGGTATITAICEENASVHAQCVVDVQVEIKSLSFYGNEEGNGVLPVERNVRTDISGKFGSNEISRIVYEPLDTTMRNVILTAYATADDLAQNVAISHDRVLIEGNYITILDANIGEFVLKARSEHSVSETDTNLTDIITVKVLDAIDANAIIAETINTDSKTTENSELCEEYLQDGVKNFVMHLANNVIGNETTGYENRKTLKFNVEAQNINNLYTIKMINTGYKNFIVTPTNEGNAFNFEQGAGANFAYVDFEIYHKGYENLFPCKQIRVRVQVSAFAEKIVLNRDSADVSTKLETITVYRNYSYNYDVYKEYNNLNGKLVEYKGAKINVKAVGESKVLFGQKIRLYIWNSTKNQIVTDASIQIKNESGIDISPIPYGDSVKYNYTVNSGEDVYITYDYNKLTADGAVNSISDSYILVAESESYKNAKSYSDLYEFESTNKLKLFTQESTVSAPQSVKIEKGKTTELINSDFANITVDISEIILESTNTTLVTVSYNQESGVWVLKHESNILGSCAINVVTPNGYKHSFIADIWQPVSISNIKVILGNTTYDVSEKEEEPYEISFVCGATLRMQIRVDGVEYDYSTLPGILNITPSVGDRNLLGVGESGFYIQINRTTPGESTLSYVITTTYDANITLYCNFLIKVTKPVTEIYINNTENNVTDIIAYNQTNVEELATLKVGRLYFMPNPIDASFNVDNFSFSINYDGVNFTGNAVSEEYGKNYLDVTEGYKFYVFSLSTYQGLEVVMAVKLDDTTNEICIVFCASKNPDIAEDAQFTIFVNYVQDFYDNYGVKYQKTISNTGEKVVVKNVVNTIAITLNQSRVTFNKNQLMLTSGIISGIENSNKHIKTLTYSINSNGALTYPGVILLDANGNPLKQHEATGEYYLNGISYERALYHLALDEINRRITITLYNGGNNFENFESGFSFTIATLDSVDIDSYGNVRYYKKATATVELLQGTPSSPYYVSSQNDLNDIRYDLSGCYCLINDINITGEWEPIGTSANPFTGSLNGQGYAINGLKINKVIQNSMGVSVEGTNHLYVGLFGYTGEVRTGADTGSIYSYSVSDLVLNDYNVSITDESNSYQGYIYAGAIVGFANAPINAISINGQIEYNGAITANNRNIVLGSVVGLLRSSLTNAVLTQGTLNFNNNLGNNIVAGGLIGYNMSGEVSNDVFNTGNTTHVNININNFSTFNDQTNANTTSTIGGVTGINNGLIQNVNSKAVIVGLNNIGGIAGYNYGTITQSSVIPTLIGSQNIGGIAGTNAFGKAALFNTYPYYTYNNNVGVLCYSDINSNFDFLGKINECKVQFTKKQQTLNYLNSSIIGYNNLGGLVGVNAYHTDTAGANGASLANENALGYTNISYSSVKQYVNNATVNALVDEASLLLNNSMYYGDIVVLKYVQSGTECENYVGSLIGQASDTSLVNCFADANINTLSTLTVIGGLIGKAQGSLFVYASPVVSQIYGNATQIGGFVGDANNIDANLAVNNFFAKNSSKNGMLDYLENVIPSEKGIFNSYTLLKNTSGNYVSNFAFKGEKVENVDLNQSFIVYTKVSDGVYRFYQDNKIIEVTGVVSGEDVSSLSRRIFASYPRLYASNSFYIGFTTSVDGTETHFEDVNTAKENAFTKSYNNLNNYSVTYAPLSGTQSSVHVSIAFTYGGQDYTELNYVGGETLLSVGINTLGSSADISGLYYAGEGNTGLTDTLPTVQPLYINNTINSGFPIPFAYEKVVTKNDTIYPNLVYEIAPESIALQYKDDYSAVYQENKILTLPYFEDASKNKFCLNDNSVIMLNIKPEFVADGKVTFTSSNPNKLEIKTEKGKVYAIVKGTGMFQINISSELNYDLNQTIQVAVYEAITDFVLVNENGEKIDSSVELIKNRTQGFNAKINGKTNFANIGFKIEGVGLATNDIFANGLDLKVGADEQAREVRSQIISLLAKNNYTNKQITITPFMYFNVNGQLFKQYFTTFSKTVSVSSINGTFAINGPDNMQIIVNNNETFDVVLTTDSEEQEFNVSIKGANDILLTKYVVEFDNGFKLKADENNSTQILSSLLQLRLIDTSKEEGTFSYTFRLSISPENYNRFTQFENFTVSVALLEDSNINNIKTYEFSLVIKPQQVQTAAVTHYTNLAYGSSISNNEGNLNSDTLSSFKYPSLAIIPGYASLISLDINPAYAQLDYVRVIPSVNALDLEQIVESSTTEYGYSEFVRYPNYIKDYETNAITIYNKVSNENGEFDGRYYFALYADQSLSTQTVSVRFVGYVTNDGADDIVVFDTTLDALNVVGTPKIDVTLEDGLKLAPVAVGTSVKLNINATDYDALSYNEDALSQYGTVEYIDGDYYFVFKTNKSSLSTIHNMLYKTITLTYTASRTLPYGVYTTESSVEILVVPFLVTGIEFNDTVNGVMDAYFNQVKELYINVNANYSLEYNNWLASENEQTILEQINNLENNINYGTDENKNYENVNGTTLSNLLYSTKPNQAFANNLQAKSYSEFIIRMIEDEDNKTVSSIQFTSTSMSSSIYAYVQIVYDKENKRCYMQYGNASGTIVNAFEASLTANIMNVSDDEYPNPILSVDDLKNMQQGESYILLNDIVLENWEPIPATFASLDGNGYTITIMSFAQISTFSTASSNINIGLFSQIGNQTLTNVVVKNLTIEVNPGYISENGIFYLNSSLEINALNTQGTALYKNIKFGVLAGENYGVITNTKVVNNAQTLRDERTGILSQYSNLGYLSVESAQDFSIYFTAFNKNSYKDTVDVVYVNSGKNNTSQGNLIGGLVGVNNGYITNSNVENVSVKGSDYIGGFVGENNGSISSSYFKGASVIDTDSNSTTGAGLGGFVANNNGNILYSYAMGIEGYDNVLPDTGIGADLDRTEYIGYKYSGIKSLNHLRSMNSAVYSQTNGGGFAYKNTGTISNSYSNILVSSQMASGFVLDNAKGEISDCYSMSSVKATGQNDIPFTSGGGVSNCYYLKVTIQDFSQVLEANNGEILINNILYTKVEQFNDFVDEFSNEKFGLGTALNSIQFADYNSFVNYAFNSDYAENIYNVSSVWFMPQAEETDLAKQNYAQFFKNSSYVYGRPELVSANLKTLSIRYYNKVENNGSISGEANEKGYYYSLVSLYKADTNGKPNKEGDLQYDIDLGSISNPITILDGDSFNENILKTVSTASEGSENVNKQALRIIKDVSFNNYYQKAETYKIVFKGNLDGNGMSINGLCIIADDDVDTTKVASVGLFSKLMPTTVGESRIPNTGIIRALNINIQEINASNINLVGILAGHIEDGKVYNVYVNGSTNVKVQGLNAVGGIAGIVTGESELINITSNVSVKANYSGNKNLFCKNNYLAKFTTFEAYNGIPLNTEENGVINNITSVSYAGGIVGIYDVENNDSISNTYIKNLDRMRTITTKGAITLEAQVVGGVVGYVGEKSHLSNAYLEVTDGMKIIASRVAGGIVAHNEGVVNRVAVYHSDQEDIDEHISQNTSTYNNPTSNKIVTGNYQTLFGNYRLNTTENSNAHFIGGVVGFNNFGTIENVYNRVDVISQDALYAGGLVGLNVGGKIDSSYTTASVYATIGIGGVIGVQGMYAKDNEDNDEVKLLIKTTNINATKGETLIANANKLNGTLNNYKDANDNITELNNIIAINIWQYNHLNPVRAQYYVDAEEASIGLLTGYVMGRNDILSYYKFPTATSRISNESMYFAQTYKIERNTSSGGVTQTKKVLNEIGNMSAFTTSFSDNELKFDDTNSISGTYANVKQQNEGNYISGDYSIDGTSYFHFSRFGRMGSLRTLSEFIARIYYSSYENDFYKFVGESKLGNQASDIKDKAQKIYVNWDILIWNGTRINDNLDKIDPEYIFPVHANNIEPSVVLVYNEDDLALMGKYLHAEFVLQQDITLSSAWKPVGDGSQPFQGTLRSAYANAEDTNAVEVNGKKYKNYKISNISINQSGVESSAFVANSKNANFLGFTLDVNFVKISNASYAGVLLGKASNTAIMGVNINGNESNSLNVEFENTDYAGGLVAYGENIRMEKNKVCNIGAKITNEVDENNKIGLNFGWMGAFVTLSKNITTVNEQEIDAGTTDLQVENASLEIVFKTRAQNTSKAYISQAVNVGGIFGTLTSATEGVLLRGIGDTTNLTKIRSNNNQIQMNINEDVECSSTEFNVGGNFAKLENIDISSTSYNISSDITGISISFSSTNYSVKNGETDGTVNIGALAGVMDAVTITTASVGSNKPISVTSNKLNVTSHFNVGGVFGKANNSTLSEISIGDANIIVDDINKNTNSIGGIIGYSASNTISMVAVYDCNISACGQSNGNDMQLALGGVAGYSYNDSFEYIATSGDITSAINSSDSNPNKYNINAGGMIGLCVDATINNASINTDVTNYFNKSNNNINHTSFVGGIIGNIYNVKFTISDSYSTGYLLNEDAIYYLNSYHTVGGVIGSVGERIQEAKLTNVVSVSPIGFTAVSNSTELRESGKVTAIDSSFVSNYDDFYKNTLVKGGIVGTVLASASNLTLKYVYYNGDFIPFSNDYGVPVATTIANEQFNTQIYGKKVLNADFLESYESSGSRINPVFIGTINSANMPLYLSSSASYGEDIVFGRKAVVYGLSSLNSTKTITNYGLIVKSKFNDDTASVNAITNYGTISQSVFIANGNTISNNYGLIFACEYTCGCDSTNTETQLNIGEGGVIAQSVIAYSSEYQKSISTSNFMRDVVCYNITTEQYIYLNYYSQSSSLSSEQTKKVSEFNGDYSGTNSLYSVNLNFENTWIIENSACAINSNYLQSGQVAFRWMYKTNLFDTKIENLHWSDYAKNETSDISVSGANITVKTAEGFAYLANLVNGTAQPESVKYESGYETGLQSANTSLSGYTVVLDADIDLGGKIWTPIGYDEGHAFSGNFDGKHHIIANMIALGADYAGLFGYVNGTNNMSNVNLIDAVVAGGNSSNSGVGTLIGKATNINELKLSKIGIQNADIYAWYYNPTNKGEFVGVYDNSMQITYEDCYAVMYNMKGKQAKSSNKIFENVYYANIQYSNGKYELVDVPTASIPTITNNSSNVYYGYNSYTNDADHGIPTSYDRLQYELLNGFDWSNVWTRVKGVNNNLPVIKIQAKYWSDYAKNETSDISVSGANITVKTAEGFAYLANLVNGTAQPESVKYESGYETGLQSANTSLSGYTVVLDADIDLGGKIWTPIGYDKKHAFSGNFNGESHKIVNMAALGAEYVGLFGYVSSDTSIQLYNVKFENADVYGKDVGVLAGTIQKNVNVTNVTVSSGSANGYANVGGIVGSASGEGSYIPSIKNCINGAVVTEHANSENEASLLNIGGIVGYLNNSAILFNCINSGEITSTCSKAFTICVGGIAGCAENYSSIDTALNTAKVVSNYAILYIMSATGGIVGKAANSATIYNVKFGKTDRSEVQVIRSEVQVIGNRNVGGIIGCMIDSTLCEAKADDLSIGKLSNGELVELNYDNKPTELENTGAIIGYLYNSSSSKILNAEAILYNANNIYTATRNMNDASKLFVELKQNLYLLFGNADETTNVFQNVNIDMMYINAGDMTYGTGCTNYDYALTSTIKINSNDNILDNTSTKYHGRCNIWDESSLWEYSSNDVEYDYYTMKEFATYSNIDSLSDSNLCVNFMPAQIGANRRLNTSSTKIEVTLENKDHYNTLQQWLTLRYGVTTYLKQVEFGDGIVWSDITKPLGIENYVFGDDNNVMYFTGAVEFDYTKKFITTIEYTGDKYVNSLFASWKINNVDITGLKVNIKKKTFNSNNEINMIFKAEASDLKVWHSEVKQSNLNFIECTFNNCEFDWDFLLAHLITTTTSKASDLTTTKTTYTLNKNGNTYTDCTAKISGQTFTNATFYFNNMSVTFSGCTFNGSCTAYGNNITTEACNGTLVIGVV